MGKKGLISFSCYKNCREKYLCYNGDSKLFKPYNIPKGYFCKNFKAKSKNANECFLKKVKKESLKEYKNIIKQV